jgi:competence protein ComGC
VSSFVVQKGGSMLIEILVVLAIIAVALFIWRNVAGRRV